MVRHTRTTVKAPISLEVEAFFIFTFASYLTHWRANTFALILLIILEIWAVLQLWSVMITNKKRMKKIITPQG